MKAKVKRTNRSEQAAQFITALHATGWHSLRCWEDAGHTFELLSRGTKTLLVQLYPDGHGFEVWRPVTSSASIAETAVACAAYGEESQCAATPVQHKTEEPQ